MAPPTYDPKDVPTRHPGERYYNPECLYNHTLLGPKDLNKSHVPNALLQNYRPFGELTPKEFLKRWWTEKGEGGDWNWPNGDDGGYLVNNWPRGPPIKGHITLKPKTLIDRFGDELTGYFCPFGTPFMMRSLGPDMLKNPAATGEEKTLYRYRVYRVEQAMTVEAGPIAPGFEQMGMGTQFIFRGTNAYEMEQAGVIRKLTDDEIEKLYASV